MQTKSTRYCLTPLKMAVIKKTRNNKCWQGCEDKETLGHCWWECKLLQPLWKIVWRFLKNWKIELPYDPAVPLLGVYLKKTKTLTQKDICTPNVHFSNIYNSQDIEQPKCPSMGEWLKKMWYVYTYMCAYIYFQQYKRKKRTMDGPLWHYVKWKVRQGKTNTIWYHLYVQSKKKKTTHETKPKIIPQTHRYREYRWLPKVQGRCVGE